METSSERSRLGLLLFAALCLAFWLTAIAAGTQTADEPDVWWVAAAGRDMLATGQVPTTNRYAVTDADIPWVMHEWLLAVPYALGVEQLGPRFFSLVSLAFATAISVSLFAATVGRVPSFAAGTLASLYALGFFGLRMTNARPTNASLVFAVAMAALAFAPRFGWRHLFAAVVAELLWTNVHGSFPVGLALLAAGAVDAPHDRRNRLVALSLAAIVTLINPYRLQLHALFWHYLRGDEPIFAFIHGHINEFGPVWRSSDFLLSRPGFGFAAIWLLPLAALRSRRWRFRAIVSIVLLGLALLHYRHAELAGLVTLVLLAPYASELLEASTPLRAPFPVARASIAILVSGVLVGLAAHGIVAARRNDVDWTGRYASFYRLSETIPDRAKVFTAFGRAGLVIWRTAPRGVRVLYDSRNDCYSVPVAADAIDLSVGKPSREKVLGVLDRYGIDHVLMPEDHVVGAALLASSAWRVKVPDRWETLSLFERVER